MTEFRVINFQRVQHYKDRNPPWIKLYNDLLDDYAFGRLPDASKMHLVAIMLLASRYNNAIPHDAEWIATRINATTTVDLDLLKQAGFIEEIPKSKQQRSKMLATCKQSALLEGERERETERETTLSGKPHAEPLATKNTKVNGSHPSVRSQALEVLGFLNRCTERNYQPVAVNLEMIEARLREGYTPLLIRRVISDRVNRWGADDKMNEYLRPATLFNRQKFSQYAGEIPPE